MRRIRLTIMVGAVAAMIGACGTNLQNLLLQSGAAAGRTYLDQLLTDLANALADARDAEDADGDDGGADNDNTGDNDNANTNDNGGGEIVGDPAAGGIAYESNGCAACHCPDAVGGCALSAPGLAGVTAGRIDDVLRGDAFHPIKVDVSDQQVADLAAYFESL